MTGRNEIFCAFFTLKLKDGVLDLDPLNFGVAGGHIVSKINMDARGETIATDADIQFKTLQLSKLFPTVKLTKSSSGTIGGHATLTGTGNSVSKMLATANGDIGLGMVGGEISNLLLEYANINGGEIIKFLFSGDKNVSIRCGVAVFKAKKGILNTEAFVFDTELVTAVSPF